MTLLIPYRLYGFNREGCTITYGVEVLNGRSVFSIENIASLDLLCKQLGKVLDGSKRYEVARTMPTLAEELHWDVTEVTEAEYEKVVKWMELAHRNFH